MPDRNPVEYDPHYVKYEKVLASFIKVNSKGNPSRSVFWGRLINAARRLPSTTGGAGQSADDVNIVLQAIRRSDADLPNIPRVRQPNNGPSQALEVYPGPFQGSIRDPCRNFPLVGRSQVIQHRNPAEHIEMLEAIRPSQR